MTLGAAMLAALICMVFLFAGAVILIGAILFFMDRPAALWIFFLFCVITLMIYSKGNV